MSDIYLQITETPTVVTLSAPVISGALSSTVTVANTVTVALDSNSLSALENVTVTVGAAITGTVSISNFPATQPVSIASVTIGNSVTIAGTVTANPTGTQTIAGTVTANAGSGFSDAVYAGMLTFVDNEGGWAVQSLPPISGTVTANIDNVSANLIGVDTPRPQQGIALGYLTDSKQFFVSVDEDSGLPVRIAGVSQTQSIFGTVTVGNSVTIASLPASSGTVTANTFALQGTAVTTSNFTSTTASTVLAGFNAPREVLSIFNEGAGNLHICAGATCTTIAYQVRLSSGDYYEVPNHQTTITHSAVFATAGTARIVQIS